MKGNQKMGWQGRAYEDMGGQERQLHDASLGTASVGIGPNPFSPYAPEQMRVVLSIAGHRFEREISEAYIINQKMFGKWIKCVDLSPAPLEEIPDALLGGAERVAFLAKWHSRLGESWGATFVLQEDGSYAAHEIFLKNVADIVERVKRK